MPSQKIDSIDTRLLAANGNVAAIELKGSVRAQSYVKGELHEVSKPVTGIFNKPNGTLSCELVYGNDFRVLETVDHWSFGQVVADGYVGYAATEDLIPAGNKTHQVYTLGSGLYKLDNLKSVCLQWLPMGSKLQIIDTTGEFAKTKEGLFVPGQHLQKINQSEADFVSLAEQYLHIPYLWGGNSPMGIDCSGLVSIALNLAGIKCPRDSDQQFNQLGTYLPEGEHPKRGDVAFWQGHVGIMLTPEKLLHATAFHMLVAMEPFVDVHKRITTTESVPFLGFKRISQQV